MAHRPLPLYKLSLHVHPVAIRPRWKRGLSSEQLCIANNIIFSNDNMAKRHFNSYHLHAFSAVNFNFKIITLIF